MIYAVTIVDGAKAAIDNYVLYLAVEKQVPQAAAKMLERIGYAINSLERWPRRCSKAPENEFRDYEIRMILVDPCVVLFTINDETKVVTIIAFRHGRQRAIEDLPSTGQ